MKLFVAGLPYDFDDTDLREMFELYGEVISAKVAIDRQTRKSRGFGFLEMANEAGGNEAIQTLNGAYLAGGKQLSVKLADDQSQNSGNQNSGGFRDRGDQRGGFRDNRGGGFRDNRDRGDRGGRRDFNDRDRDRRRF
ncbi:MAG: RNA-binding protein [Bacteroidetes bacterium]|nr:RNA-binding protein [Bacteroidota bacterium]